jgi:hypothetical protein
VSLPKGRLIAFRYISVDRRGFAYWANNPATHDEAPLLVRPIPPEHDWQTKALIVGPYQGASVAWPEDPELQDANQRIQVAIG